MSSAVHNKSNTLLRLAVVPFVVVLFVLLICCFCPFGSRWADRALGFGPPLTGRKQVSGRKPRMGRK